MILNIKKNYPDAKLPEHANPSDAGLDVFVHSMKIVGETIGNFGFFRSIQYIEYDTGLSIQPSSDVWPSKSYFTYLAPRSSISKYNLLMCNGFGVIDANYVGPVKLRMKYIPDAQDYVFYDTEKHPHFGIQINEKKIYQVGDKCGQLIVTNQPFINVLEVDSLEETERGIKGFGSTGV